MVHEQAGELAELRRQVAALRRERMDRARKLPVRVTLERAIADTERDVDAVTTPEVQALRDEVEQFTDRLRAVWESADWKRLARLRVQSTGIEFDDLAHAPQLLAVLAEEQALRAECANTFAQAGMTLVPPEPLTLTLPQHPNSAGVADVVEQSRQLMAEHEMRLGRTRTRREPDRHAW